MLFAVTEEEVWMTLITVGGAFLMAVNATINVMLAQRQKNRDEEKAKRDVDLALHVGDVKKALQQNTEVTEKTHALVSSVVDPDKAVVKPEEAEHAPQEATHKDAPRSHHRKKD